MGEVTTKTLALRLNLYNYESHIVDRGMGLGCGCIVDHNNNFELNKDPRHRLLRSWRGCGHPHATGAPSLSCR